MTNMRIAKTKEKGVPRSTGFLFIIIISFFFPLSPLFLSFFPFSSFYIPSLHLPHRSCVTGGSYHVIECICLYLYKLRGTSQGQFDEQFESHTWVKDGTWAVCGTIKPKACIFKILIGFFFHLWQCMALFGALLFFLDMKNAFPIKQSKKKAPKAKTVQIKRVFKQLYTGSGRHLFFSKFCA